MLRVVLVASLPPLGNGLSVKDDDVEKRVHEENAIRLDAAGVQQDGLRRTAEGVGVQDGLDHDQRLRQVLPVQHVPVIRCFVGTVVEHLEKLGPP
uniref:Putative secreted protein n=1 Tax=Ixodes ricinus TaxID=34613 RepID=A0A6B0UCQ8_IXORI